MKSINRSTFLRHFLYVFGSQIIVLVSGLIKALLIPVVLEISDYGYWQVYTFYTIYIGIFTFGYNDGIYLKYGGSVIDDFPYQKLRTSNALYVAVISLCTIGLAGLAFFMTGTERQFIFYALAANILFLGITANISLTLQAANMMKGYAILTSTDKVFFMFALLAMLSPNFRTFYFLVAVDIFAKLAVMVVLLYRYRILFFGKMANFSKGLSEFISSVRSGIKLMLANLSGMMVLGVGRLIIEYFGALESYAYYSFAVSLTNVVLICISALSIVLYPVIRQQPKDQYLSSFNTINRSFLWFSLVIITAYFPAVIFIKAIAINYSPVLVFLNVMFVITILQGKMQLVNNTYYKALRLERKMLNANFLSLLIVIILSSISYFWTQSILSIVYSALITMVFRVYASEIFLRINMGEDLTFRPLLELILFIVFIVITTFAPLLIAIYFWTIIIAVLTWHGRHHLIQMLVQFKGRNK